MLRARVQGTTLSPRQRLTLWRRRLSRRWLARARARLATRIVPPPGTTVLRPNPRRPEPLAEIRLFAVLGTWMEADVVGACVSNAFRQGCERVFLLDNASPDDTVTEAVAAGAELAVSYTTVAFEEHMRADMMHAVARQISLTTDAQHVWWLYLDADEFPHGPGGGTIRDLLTTLDRCFRIVGSHCYEHYPAEAPAYVPGTHPIDRMPLCRLRTYSRCPGGHVKHPLQRFDRNGPELRPTPGMHEVNTAMPPFESDTAILTHHFPFREEATTRARLAAFCTPNAQGTVRDALQSTLDQMEYGDVSPAMRRWKMFDAIYHETPRPMLADCRPFTEQVSPADAHIARWY